MTNLQQKLEDAVKRGDVPQAVVCAASADGEFTARTTSRLENYFWLDNRGAGKRMLREQTTQAKPTFTPLSAAPALVPMQRKSTKMPFSSWPHRANSSPQSPR